MYKVLLFTLVAVCCTSLSFSQKALGIYHQYQQGNSQADIRLGLSSISNILDFGVDYDYVLRSGNVWGPGSFDVGGSIDISGNGLGNGTYMPIAAHCGYHLGPLMENTQWDPFVNLGLAFLYWHYSGGAGGAQNVSGLYLQFVFGVNYYFQKDWFALASYGYNTSGLSFGIGHSF